MSEKRTENARETHACDSIRRQDAIDAIGDIHPLDYNAQSIKTKIENLPSVQPEYEPVTAEDFAKTMSENTLYSFMAWYGGALALMKEHGFVICKKTI